MASSTVRATAFTGAALLLLAAWGGGDAETGPEETTPDRAGATSSSHIPFSRTSTT